MMFVVVRQGVYRHEVFGVYETLELARPAAERMLNAEPDEWHCAVIVKCELNSDAKLVTTESRYSAPFDEEEVATCKRVDQTRTETVPYSINGYETTYKKKVVTGFTLEWSN